MMVMVSNQTGKYFDPLAEQYYPQGLLGHLYSPDGLRVPRACYPYALDNWAFSAFKRRVPWDADAYLTFCDRYADFDQPPMWALVPDVVADREGTIASWQQWSRFMRRRYGWRQAFAVQDGMTAADVPATADVVFVGGSWQWKLSTLAYWTRIFGRVHAARINRVDLLWRCEELGCESVDGTGWWHTDNGQYAGLCEWLQAQAGGGQRMAAQQQLALTG